MIVRTCPGEAPQRQGYRKALCALADLLDRVNDLDTVHRNHFLANLDLFLGSVVAGDGDQERSTFASAIDEPGDNARDPANRQALSSPGRLT